MPLPILLICLLFLFFFYDHLSTYLSATHLFLYYQHRRNITNLSTLRCSLSFSTFYYTGLHCHLCLIHYFPLSRPQRSPRTSSCLPLPSVYVVPIHLPLPLQKGFSLIPFFNFLILLLYPWVTVVNTLYRFSLPTAAASFYCVATDVQFFSSLPLLILYQLLNIPPRGRLAFDVYMYNFISLPLPHHSCHSSIPCL